MVGLIQSYAGALDATAREAITAHIADLDNPHDTTAADVGLGNVDNTSDASKPISSLQAAALALKAPLASPTFTGSPAAPTAATGDVSTLIATTANAQAKVNAAVVGKADLASPTFTGVPSGPTAAPGTNTTQFSTTAFVTAAAAVVTAATAAADAILTAAAAAAQADADQALVEALPVPSLVAAVHQDRPGEAVRLYGETKTGEPDDVTFIDPTWITTSNAGNVVRVDGATAADPQTVAPAGAFAMESMRVYEVRFKVQRQSDPGDPLNDSVTLGIRWLQNSKAGIVSGGETTIENIPLVVADGIQERIVTIALTGRDGVDYNAPAGTVYCRPFVDLYGSDGITDIIVIDIIRVTFATYLDIGLRTGVDGADPGVLLHRSITDDTGLGAGTTAHGFVDQSLFSRTGVTAYASFDARVAYSGTTDFDHYVGFQSRPGFTHVGALGSYRGHDSQLSGGSASTSVTNANHFAVHDDASFNGTITSTQYGLSVDALTKGAINWGVWVNNNDCKFGSLITKKEGNIQGVNGSIGKSAFFMSGANNISGIYRAAASAMAVQYEAVEKLRVDVTGVRVWDNSGLDCHLDIRGYRGTSWAANVATSATWAATNGGEITIGTTTAHGVAVGQQFVLSGFTPTGYNGIYGAATGTTGSTLVAAKLVDPGASTVQGQLDAKVESYGNAVLSMASPSSATAAGATIANRAFMVLPSSSGVTTTDFVIGATDLGNGSLDGGVGGIKTDADIYQVFDTDGWLAIGRRSSTEFARISGTSDSFIDRDADAIHRFSMTNPNVGTGAGTEIAIHAGASVNDRFAMRVNGSGFTTSGFQIQDAGVIYTGSAISAGFVLGTLAGPIQMFAGGGTQLAATLTAGTRPSFVIGNDALTTLATDGFLYIASTPGVPTGVPTSFTGRVALAYNTVANTLYVYNGAWRSVAVA